jgi:tetratricopeptide (TPR) repeat protein
VAQIKHPIAITEVLWPPDAVYHLLRAKIYLRNGQLKEAEAVLRKGCSGHPRNMSLAIEFAKVATLKEDWSQAVKRWRKVIETFAAKAPAKAYRALSQAHCKQAQFESADAVLHSATELYSGNLQLAVDYAKIAGFRKSWTEAVRRFLRIIENFGYGVPPEIYVSLSKAYRMLGQFDAAEATVQGVRQTSPLLAMEYADIAMARQDWPEATRRWNRALAEFGNRLPVDASLRIALTHRLQGGLDFAALVHQLSFPPSILLSGYGPIEQTIERTSRPFRLSHLRNKVCVHLHLYHPGLGALYLKNLSYLTVPFGLYVSIPQTESEAYWKNRISRALPLAEVDVKAVTNRGRDVMPWLCVFDAAIRQFDLMLHMHTKASQQSSKAILWHDFLLDNVCGSRGVVSSILNFFEEDPNLGLIYPPYFFSLQRQPNWGRNREACQHLYSRLFSEQLPDQCPDYPAGSFFWARTRFLAPLFDLNLAENDFPTEEGQTDGTLVHAIERVIGILDRHTGMTKKCVSTTPTLSLDGWLKQLAS